jgi:catechol 2,3-dioxygenase
MVLEIKKETRIDPRTSIGSVMLAVKNLEETAGFYQNAIGLEILKTEEDQISLGVDGSILVELIHRPDGQAYPMRPGLYHMAILVPSRQDLGHWLEHFTKQGLRLTGVADHLVSEALYLSDPEGNGIEIYRDRPREDWTYVDGELVMDTLALDLYPLLEDAHKRPFSGMAEGTKIGHVHLQVNNLQETTAYYRDVVGFDLTTGIPAASFVSAGGYHHHIGLNTWRSLHAEKRPDDALGLVGYQIVLPDEDALNAHLSTLEERGEEIDRSRAYPQVTDPSGNNIQLVSN